MLPLRLRRVIGHESRVNDVLFQPAAERPADCGPQTLVFFGGDVQDYPEIMQSHRDNRNYVRWNLESTARLLARDFPNKHVLVVRPSRIEYKSFSCYDNFVPSNNAGVPDHTPTHSALHHLEKLLQNVCHRIKLLPASELLEAMAAVAAVAGTGHADIDDLHNASIQHPGEESKPSSNGSTKNDETAATGSSEPSVQKTKPELDPLWWRERLNLDESCLSLVGFSKGCVVLNQLVYEMHYTHTLTPGDRRMMRFIERMRAMYWLDGGHAGGKNTWITSRSLLETLTRLDIEIQIHVTAYQVKDEARPWIAREEKAFTTLLNKLGAHVARFFHEQDGPQTLQMHFEVLNNFKRIGSSNTAQTIEKETSDDES